MYNIWNYNYIQQHAQQQYHQNQVFQVADTARKLQDFLDSRVLCSTTELCQEAWYYIKTGVIYGIDH